MKEDRALLIGFLFTLAAVIVGASFAINHAQVVPSLPLNELPLAAPTNNGFDPSAESCQGAGGTVAYERSSECTSVPSVTDACDWGIPCFFVRDEPHCRDVRRAYCACTSTAQCPNGYACDIYGREGRCHLIPPAYAPKPILR